MQNPYFIFDNPILIEELKDLENRVTVLEEKVKELENSEEEA